MLEPKTAIQMKTKKKMTGLMQSKAEATGLMQPEAWPKASLPNARSKQTDGDFCFRWPGCMQRISSEETHRQWDP